MGTKNNVPNVNRPTFRDLEAAARLKIPGLQTVDFSRLDLTMAQLFVNYLPGHCARFYVDCQNIRPHDWPDWQKAVPAGTPAPRDGAAFLTYTSGISYEPKVIGPGLAPKLRRTYRALGARLTGDPNRSLECLLRHEAFHLAQFAQKSANREGALKANLLILAKWNELAPDWEKTRTAPGVAAVFGSYAASIIYDNQRKPRPATELFPECATFYDLAPTRFPIAHRPWIAEVIRLFEGRIMGP
jgi:hypothetical protein